jgi:hypothetical protein
MDRSFVIIAQSGKSFKHSISGSTGTCPVHLPRKQGGAGSRTVWLAKSQKLLRVRHELTDWPMTGPLNRVGTMLADYVLS